MKTKINAWDTYMYVEVYKITQYKDGCVYKTKPIGFAHRDRPKQKDETYASLSMKLICGKAEIELDLME